MSRRFQAVRLIFLLLPALFASSAPAQFGKNKVQYKSFEWHTIQTDHFDIYYYEGEEESAFHAARMAERGYRRLSTILNHEIPERVPVIVYASHTDFQQTNISPGLIPEGVGGITEYSKRRVFLPFTGSYGEFDHVLTHELVHAFQVDILFGVTVDTNPFSFQPPLWFMEGMAEYLSIGGVDPNTEMWLRWSALEGQLVPLHYMSRIYDIRVYRIGQAVFAFLGEMYGDEKIGELLRKTVALRSLNLAFERTLGMDLETLDEEWEDYVRRKYYPQIVHLNRPERHGRRLLKKKGFNGIHLAPALSPDGSRVVYIRDARFSKDIVMASAIDGKILGKLVEGERSGDFESLRYFYTSIGWSPDGTRIAFPSKKGGEDVLNVLDVEKRKVLQTLGFDFDALYSPCFHPNGRQIVFSGIRGGKSDLFLLELQTGELTQVTDDPHLARDPQWSPDGRRIAFVTDRGPDTDLENLIFGKPKIALLDVETGAITLLPGQVGKNITPQWGPDGDHIAFVSDRDGISNLYVQNLNNRRLYRLTNLITGVTGIIESSPPFSWARDGSRLVFTTFMGDGWELYEIDDPLSKMIEVEMPEPIEQIAQRERETLAPWSLPDRTSEDVILATNGSGQGHATTATNGSPLDSSAEEKPTRIADLLAPSSPSLTIAGPGPLDPIPSVSGEADGAPFAPEQTQLTLSQVMAETTYDLPERTSLESQPYRLKWAPDFIGAAPFFASNVGFAGSAQIAISDILSNHVIHIGASVYGSLSDADLFLGYTNLKHRTNWGVSAFQFRNDFGIFAAQDRIGYQSQIYRGVQGIVSRPFSKFSRIELAGYGVAVSRSVFEQSHVAFGAPQQIDADMLYYAGPEIALVTDNVVYSYYGPVYGRRARISTAQAFGDVQYNTTIGDYRQYFPLGSSAVFALRLLGGVSRGNTPQIFRIGGPETIRGLSYGQLEGNHIGIFNAELRFPLVETLRLGWPLRVGLGGIGGVLFFDAGGAWWENARFIKNGRFDDLTGGYGFGFRLGLGYFALKYDVAWRTDIRSRIGGARKYFTIGIDY
jgi:Tol biopolymer transport system component